MDVLTQAYSHIVNSAVYEETAQKLDGIYSKICCS